MKATVMPMRYNIICHLIHKNVSMTPAQIFQLLTDIYIGEKQCNVKEIDTQLMSLSLAGLVEIAESSIPEDGTLESAYKITPYGVRRSEKYIGKYLQGGK